MTSNKLLSLLTRTTLVLPLLIVATILVAGPLATATTTTTTEEEKIVETQDVSTDNLSESDRDVNGIEFTPRWGAVSTIEPNAIAVLFANCLDDEFAVSSMSVFETSDIIPSQSFPVALPDNTMTWVAVVQNTDTDDARAGSIGVICADENDGDGGGGRNLDITTKNTIQNTVKNIINVQNNQIVNLQNVVSVYQSITNYAIQIATISGNNNTVNQAISQAATQIVNANATSPTQIDQIIRQNAEQQGVITGGGGNVLNQTIDQDAEQAANVTGGGGNVLDQIIGQGAEQAANVTGGGGNVVDQGIDQDASQAANVTGGGGNALDQFLGQGAEQAANVTGEE